MPVVNVDWKLLLAAGLLVGLGVWYTRRQVIEVAEALDPTDPNNIVNRKVTQALAPALGTNKLTGKPNTIGSKLYYLFNE